MKLSLPFSIRRNSPIDDSKIEKTRQKLCEFFSDHKIEDTTLVIDGPGVACLGIYLVPLLLGYENLKRFKEVHTFSAGSFALLWLKAFDECRRNPDIDMQGFYKWNQLQHGLRFGPLSGMAKYIWRKLICRKQTLYEPDTAYRANAAHYPFDDSIKNWTGSVFPENWHIWSYDLTSKDFVNLGGRSPYDQMPTASVIEATTAIPGVYDPHPWRGFRFIDCVFAPEFKNFARGILKKSRPLMFCNMSRDKQTQGTLYIKAHASGSPKQRVNGDLMRFFGGFGHPEYQENLKVLERLGQANPMKLDGPS